MRTPEQALCDPALLAEGSVIEVDDPELGRLRQVGAPYRMHDRPIHVRWPAPEPGDESFRVSLRRHPRTPRRLLLLRLVGRLGLE